MLLSLISATAVDIDLHLRPGRRRVSGFGRVSQRVSKVWTGSSTPLGVSHASMDSHFSLIQSLAVSACGS